VLNSLKSSLVNIRKNFRQKYLVIDQEPKLDSIVVKKYPGGNTSAPITIPQDPVNGWTYAGYISDYLIDDPIQLNFTSSYMIELHGTARLWGLDSADVTFTPLNGADST
jgi:hypothetical protein